MKVTKRENGAICFSNSTESEGEKTYRKSAEVFYNILSFWRAVAIIELLIILLFLL
jgi:hypothetical protein